MSVPLRDYDSLGKIDADFLGFRSLTKIKKSYQQLAEYETNVTRNKFKTTEVKKWKCSHKPKMTAFLWLRPKHQTINQIP